MKFSGFAFAVVALSAASSVAAGHCKAGKEYCFKSLSSKEREAAGNIMVQMKGNADDAGYLPATFWKCTGNKGAPVEFVKRCGNFCNRAHIVGKDKCEDSSSTSRIFHWRRA